MCLCVIGVAGVWQYGEYTTSRQLNIQQYIFTTQYSCLLTHLLLVDSSIITLYVSFDDWIEEAVAINEWLLINPAVAIINSGCCSAVVQYKTQTLTYNMIDDR